MLDGKAPLLWDRRRKAVGGLSIYSYV